MSFVLSTEEHEHNLRWLDHPIFAVNIVNIISEFLNIITEKITSLLVMQLPWILDYKLGRKRQNGKQNRKSSRQQPKNLSCTFVSKPKLTWPRESEEPILQHILQAACQGNTFGVLNHSKN